MLPQTPQIQNYSFIKSNAFTIYKASAFKNNGLTTEYKT